MSCESLTHVVLPPKLDRLPPKIFANCSALHIISIPDGVGSICCEAFADCSSLVAVSFNNELNRISTAAFKNCTSLTAVALPKSCVNVATTAFKNCKRLKIAQNYTAQEYWSPKAHIFCTPAQKRWILFLILALRSVLPFELILIIAANFKRREVMGA